MDMKARICRGAYSPGSGSSRRAQRDGGQPTTKEGGAGTARSTATCRSPTSLSLGRVPIISC
ncbi:hypothetical protein C8Q80DRAFT_1215041 [Daedaleopsis nitida]|nr:hypothetical protein C8Q80DRAFT_1215041 [Daedaleopsis nitida]